VPKPCAIERQVDAYVAHSRSIRRIASRAGCRSTTTLGLVACFLLPLLRGVPFVALDPFEWVMRPGGSWR